MSKPPPPQTAERSRVLLGWLWRGYLRRYLGLLGIALIFMLIEGSMVGALSYMMQPMFDEVLVAGNSNALWWVSVAILGIFVIRAFSGVIQKVLLTRIALLTAADIRFDLLDRLIRQDGAFHQSHPPGFLIQRVQSDVDAVNMVWRAIITGAGRDVITLVVLMGVAINIDWKWAAIACIGTPLMLAPALMAQRYVRKKASQARDLGAVLATRLDEVFHGIVPVKLNALERYQAKRYREHTDTFVYAETRASFGTATIPGLVDIMAGLGFMGVLIYGGSEIIAGEKTVGQFMSFFTAMGLAFDPLRRLGAISGLWQSAAAAIERIKALMEAPIMLTSPDNPVAPPAGVPEVRLDGVTVRYADTPVLNDVSLVAEAGKTTALVGASGAGKSTIFNLLTRLVDAEDGETLIGDVDTKAMSLGDLRGLFSVVSQEALLFDETLRENVLLGRQDVPEERLKEVLDAAHVSDFLPSLPDGLDTEVGPRGSALSGGQRQRVVIARALLRDTPILLLDEATSALDAQSEQVVQDALDRLSGGRTTLVIAHRLSTIQGADKIVVMDRGRIVDEGSHDELLERGGLYADLYRLQFKEGKAVAEPLGSAPPNENAIVPHSDATGWLSRLRVRLFG
ncbi:ABC transporter ATP-binding protein [Thalassococcus sp. S3]|uniref:ABC transporter ATP-binding protein n=1 Tax=Thalassococcus sp. S3 TaxID=2017482 RepID=UPI0010242B95|nr:ABC transporter ATP-binding protein [Thalassococcus sp. S3]QBF31129.1 ABC transporter ATP-binding protein [Thalassococcus sp. S3]